jgi:hypothetical protein
VQLVVRFLAGQILRGIHPEVREHRVGRPLGLEGGPIRLGGFCVSVEQVVEIPVARLSRAPRDQTPSDTVVAPSTATGDVLTSSAPADRLLCVPEQGHGEDGKGDVSQSPDKGIQGDIPRDSVTPRTLGSSSSEDRGLVLVGVLGGGTVFTLVPGQECDGVLVHASR